MSERPLARAFFARPAEQVAPELVGRLLRRDGVTARIVETEAYHQDDPACHAHRRRTVRNAPLFGPPGHAYVYFSYGMHWCFNIATGVEGVGEGCLIRAAEPLDGLEVVRVRRPGVRERDLLRGPARLCAGLDIHGAYSGADLCGAETFIAVLDDGASPAVSRGPRVGVSQGADAPWRWWVTGSPWVSAYQRSPRAAPPGEDPWRPEPRALGSV